MDPPVAFNVLTRSSSDDGVKNNRNSLSGNVQNISSSLDSWKERRKLIIESRGKLDVFKEGLAEMVGRGPVRRATAAPLASVEDDDEIREADGDDEQTVTSERQKPHELTLSLCKTMPSTHSNDRKTIISSHNISSSQRSSSGTSSSGVSLYRTPPASPSSKLHHLLHEWGNAEETGGEEKRDSAAKETTTEIRSPKNITTIDRSRMVPRSGGDAPELASSSSSSSSSSPSFLKRTPPTPTVSPPVFNSSFSPLSTRSVSATSTAHGYGGSDGDISCGAGEEERCSLSRRKRATEVLTIGGDAHTDAKEGSYLGDRSNSKAIGSSEDTIDDEKDNTRDVDDGLGSCDHQQKKNILTQNSEDDEMWNVDLTAIEATETLNNENARQKLLLRRKSSLAQRQRPTRTRKRFSDSEIETESSNLNVESVTHEKKTRDIRYADLPKADEHKRSPVTSPKIRNELSEVNFQNVLKERKDPGLQLKKEKDQENRAVLDTTPVVLRKNSYNSFDNTAGNRKPLFQEITFDRAKPSDPEKTTPFVKLRRTPRHHELIRDIKGPQSSEDPQDKTDSPQVGSENNNNNNNRQRISDLRKETNRNSFPSAEIQPRVLRSVSRVDRRIFEDGPKTTISAPEDDWLKKRHSIPSPLVPVPRKNSSSSNDDFKSGEKTEKWSVIRQPLDSGTDNKNTKLAVEEPAWLKRNLEPRRTNSYHFTPPAKESDSNESEEAPWIKEFRTSRKRVGRIFSNREPVKLVSDEPSSIETPPTRISKPLSSLATTEQPSRGIVSAKIAVTATPSPVPEKKKTTITLPEVSVTPKYKSERKSSFNNINEGGISSSMKENRSPVSRNSINTTEPYLPSWSVADAGEAPASLADTRGEIPEWQRKLAEKNKLKKQSFRRTKSEGSELYEQDYEIETTPVDTVSYLVKEQVATMYSQNNNPYAAPGAYPQSSASVPDVNAYQGQWYSSNPQPSYYDGYDPNYYYGYGQQHMGTSNMSYSTSNVSGTEYQQSNYGQYQNQQPPLTKAYSFDSIDQYEGNTASNKEISKTRSPQPSPRRSPKFGDMSLSPSRQSNSDSRTASPKSPRYIRVLPEELLNGASPASSPRKSERSEHSPISSRNSSPLSRMSSRRASSSSSSSPEPESPVNKKSSSKGLPTFSLSNAEGHTGGRKSRYSNKPMYVRVLPLPPPSLPNKLSPKKMKEYTDISPNNSPSRIPVPITPSKESSPKSFKHRFFSKKHERTSSNTSSTFSDDADRKSKGKYKFNLKSPKFSPFRKTKNPTYSDEEETSNLPATPQKKINANDENVPGTTVGPEKGPYYRILRSPLKTKSLPSRSYSMPDPPPEDVLEQRSRLRPVELKKSPRPVTPEKLTQHLKRGQRIEDSSSPKAQTEDGTPAKAQPAWRQQLKNRTSSVDQTDKKSDKEKPDWIKQAEERRARLAKNKLLAAE